MKNTLFLLLLIIPFFANSQNANKMCNERGHVLVDSVFCIDLKQKPYIKDYDSYSVLVTPTSTYAKYKCARCGNEFVKLWKAKKEIIWHAAWLSNQDILSIKKEQNLIETNQIK